MSVDRHRPSDLATDDALVGRVIHAVQGAVASAAGVSEASREVASIPAPEVATALLNVLASVLEEAPGCATQRDLRLLGGAAGNHLTIFMKGVRRLKDGSPTTPGPRP